MFGRLVGILIMAAVVSIDASAQQSLQQFESISEFERALAAVDAIKHRKKFQCVTTIANGKLCECLSQNRQSFVNDDAVDSDGRLDSLLA
jgi:hypothetical protein